MTSVRISSKHQITLPKPVLDSVQVEAGDLLHAAVEDGRIILTPQRVKLQDIATTLTPQERRALERAQRKIQKIKEDVQQSKGLTVKEIKAAVKAELIDPDQGYFWTEKWQKGYREAQREIQAGLSGPSFDHAEDALAYLHREGEKYK